MCATGGSGSDVPATPVADPFITCLIQAEAAEVKSAIAILPTVQERLSFPVACQLKLQMVAGLRLVGWVSSRIPFSGSNPLPMTFIEIPPSLIGVRHLTCLPWPLVVGR